MSGNSHPQAAELEFYSRRARRLRSAAAISAIQWIGNAILGSIRRAYVRPYRMVRTPGCGCEA